MKKVIVFITLIFTSLSFACDQPFDEVSGVKIGCPIRDQGLMFNKELKVYQIEKPVFFDIGRVVSIDGHNVSAVIFIKKYDVTYQNESAVRRDIASDLKGLMLTVVDRWGLFDDPYKEGELRGSISTIGRHDVHQTAEITTKPSNAVAHILFEFKSNAPVSRTKDSYTAYLTVAYMSQKTIALYKESEKSKFDGL